MRLPSQVWTRVTDPAGRRGACQPRGTLGCRVRAAGRPMRRILIRGRVPYVFGGLDAEPAGSVRRLQHGARRGGGQCDAAGGGRSPGPRWKVRALSTSRPWLWCRGRGCGWYPAAAGTAAGSCGRGEGDLDGEAAAGPRAGREGGVVRRCDGLDDGQAQAVAVRLACSAWGEPVEGLEEPL